MTLEAVFTGREVRLVEVRRPEPIAELGERQKQWLEERFPGITRNRVQRLERNDATGQ